jgi:hypothetical protein
MSLSDRHLRYDDGSVRGAIMTRGMSRSKFPDESALVGCFLQVLGYRNFSFQDPNVQPSVETGSDVLVLLDGKRYGVQVTLLHADEGLTAAQRARQWGHV